MAMQIGSTTTPIARKRHQCWWCGESIEPGTKYVRWLCKDGDVVQVKVHPECCIAWDSLSFSEVQEVHLGEFNRGCTCEHGYCRCPAQQEK